MELNSAVPVTAGRGHWKAMDVISFLILQSYIYCLPWVFLCIYLLLISSRNFVEEIFYFCRTPVNESDDSQRLGFGISFVCEEVLLIINSVVYGFIIGQFMWIFSKAY